MNFSDSYESLFAKALRIRLVEERIIDVYPTDKIQSPVHLSIGQEAVAVGVCEGLVHTDLLFGSYRSHAFYLAKGGSLREMFAELYGKVTGCCGGKAGSMHLAAPEVGFMGASAVVASTIPHSVGAALAAKVLGKEQVSVTVFGDGAVEQGVYHESLNFAALHQVPLIFVCENNGLAVHAKLEARQAFEILKHAETYGLSTTRIEEGYDPVVVQTAFDEILQSVRKTAKPHFVEILTCRYREHVGPGDDGHADYRPQGFLDSWKAKDPLLRDLDLVARLSPEILSEIDEAVAFAEESPYADAGTLLTDVL